MVRVIAHNIIVPRLSANNATESDGTVERRSSGRTRFSCGGQGQRNFERAGYRDPFVGRAALFALGDRPLDEVVGDVFVEARFDEKNVRTNGSRALFVP